MDGFLRMLGHNDVSAYLVMMAPRLYHLHRVLKPTGSLYLHCDPTASHYLKILLDAIFGAKNFRNEIIWKRTSAHNDTAQGLARYGRNHDVILFYAKGGATWNAQYVNYDNEYLTAKYNYKDEDGRRWKSSDMSGPGGAAKGNPFYEFMGVTRYWRYSQENMEKMLAEGRIYQPKPGAVPRMKHYLDEMKGVGLQDNWDDIPPINSMAKERMGYSTQKPLALLERIITASSNPGDVVLDPFCGCGTAIVAAQTLGRRWLGIDVTPIATSLIISRLADMDCRDTRVAKAGDADYARAFDVTGLPTSTDGALELFRRNPKDFEMWAVGLIPMTPQDKKGADGGIDGMRDYLVGDKKPLRAVAQVKGGHVGAPQVQQLRGAMERFGAQVGVFVSLEAPTRNMEHEASLAGFYRLPQTGRDIPRIQLRTVADLLDRRGFDLPLVSAASQAVTVAARSVRQAGLGI